MTLNTSSSSKESVIIVKDAVETHCVPAGEIESKFQEPGVQKDIRLLAKFISVFCEGQHRQIHREPMEFRFLDLQALMGTPLLLCESCRPLLIHAMMKRAMCPYDPKPTCKKCKTHCYAPKYREMIRQVMKYSGRKLVLSGRVDYLLKLFF